MSIFKSAEVLLLLAFGLLCGAACFTTPAPRATGRPAAGAPLPTTMPVVVVTAQRLTADEKRNN